MLVYGPLETPKNMKNIKKPFLSFSITRSQTPKSHKLRYFSENHENSSKSGYFSENHEKFIKKWSKRCQFSDFSCQIRGPTSLIIQCSPTEHHKVVTVRKPLKITVFHEIIGNYRKILRSQPLVSVVVSAVVSPCQNGQYFQPR